MCTLIGRNIDVSEENGISLAGKKGRKGSGDNTITKVRNATISYLLSGVLVDNVGLVRLELSQTY